LVVSEVTTILYQCGPLMRALTSPFVRTESRSILLVAIFCPLISFKRFLESYPFSQVEALRAAVEEMLHPLLRSRKPFVERLSFLYEILGGGK